MTIQEGRFEPLTEEEILAAMLEAAEEAFDRDLQPDETAAIIHFAEPFAAYFADQQQQLREVLNAAQIDHAEGQALDYLAALIGVPRRDARAARTRLQFRSDEPVTRDYTIPEGSRGQTDDADPVTFETNYASSLQYIDGFESNNIDDYGGDTGSFQTQSGTVATGSYALEGTAAGDIANLGIDIEYGSRFHYKQNLTAGANAGFLFGATDLQNYYDVTISESSVSIGLTEAGSRSELGSGSVSLNTSEWYDIQVDWGNEGTITVVVEDNTGTEVTTVTGSEPSVTHESGGIGFTNETSNSVFFDEATTSRVSVSATATEKSAETNVAAGSVIVLGTNINGVDSVTNPNDATGGRDKELDPDYRERVKDELSQGTRATLPAVINVLDQLPDTKTVTVIDNDTNTADADGRPGHSFEPLVDAPVEAYDDIAEALVETKALGDTSVGGYAGTEVTRTVELSNGQQKDVAFSIPDPIQIYIDADVETVPGEYPGDDRIKTSVVQYIGGTISSGDTVDGEIGVGDDVIYNQVLEAIMDIRGVHDVTNLEVGTSMDPTGTSNISIANSENATADATDNSLDVTTTDI
jgi:uncharacterized phage protein gp47/JayE